MKNRYISELKEICMHFLSDDDVKLFLFGSRAKKRNSPYSDVDIGIIPYSKFNERKISLLKEQIENSHIPYKVDIVNFNTVSDRFKKEALQDIEIWKE